PLAFLIVHLTLCHPHVSSSSLFSLFFMLLRPPRSPLFPYTTLFRSPVPRSSPPAVVVSDRENVDIDSLGKFVGVGARLEHGDDQDRKSTRLNSSHQIISYAVFCLKKKKIKTQINRSTRIS